MKISDEDADKWKALIKKEFGDDITRDEARAMKAEVVELYKVLARPLPSEIEERKATK